MTDAIGQSDPDHQDPPQKGQRAVKAACSSPISGTERREEKRGSIVVTLNRSAEPAACWEPLLSVASVGGTSGTAW